MAAWPVKGPVGVEASSMPINRWWLLTVQMWDQPSLPLPLTSCHGVFSTCRSSGFIWSAFAGQAVHSIKSTRMLSFRSNFLCSHFVHSRPIWHHVHHLWSMRRWAWQISYLMVLKTFSTSFPVWSCIMAQDSSQDTTLLIAGILKLVHKVGMNPLLPHDMCMCAAGVIRSVVASVWLHCCQDLFFLFRVMGAL